MIRTADITTFLTAAGVTAPISVNGATPPPNRVVEITVLGGAGTSHERLFDRASVQIRVRGNQNDPADAETLATQVDHAFMTPIAPITLGGRPVVRVDYLGGPPGFVTRDNARRTVLSCTYLIELARD